MCASVSSVRADQKDEEIRLLKAENRRLKRRIGEIDSDSSDSDGGGGDVRKTWNELGSDRKRRILAKICRDMYKVAEIFVFSVSCVQLCAHVWMKVAAAAIAMRNQQLEIL